MLQLLKVEIKYEHDVVLARQRARQLAELLGYDSQDQVRIATSVSELARNAYQYAGGGTVHYSLDNKARAMKISVRDTGAGIGHLDVVLSGNYESKTGMGLGIIGARRLMDHFDIHTDSKGTSVDIEKKLPKRVKEFTPEDIHKITDSLINQQSYDPFQEIQKQNQELLTALNEVQRQRTTLTELNQELEETNRGVVALYAELDQRADYLTQASEMKTQFLSNMTHEFRTPLNSVLSISQMLLDRLDGDLSEEQEKQVTFIQASAKSLSEMVNDLLDLAKVEAGKVIIRTSTFEVSEMFRMLRGMLKPLIDANQNVALVFEEPHTPISLLNDEGKISQILRNFISNGLKYTDEGEVRVSANVDDDGNVIFSVKDTGIGISPEDQKRIFEEFTQVESSHQHKVKGTGLGLPLSQRLAKLLTGSVNVESEAKKGSTFTLIIPMHYTGPSEGQYTAAAVVPKKHERILVIDDNPADRYVIKKLVSNYADVILEAPNGVEGLALALTVRPSLIILDLSMPDMNGEETLKKLKKKKETADIPVMIHTSKLLTAKDKKNLMRHAAAILEKGTNKNIIIAEIDKVLHRTLPPVTGLERKASYV